MKRKWGWLAAAVLLLPGIASAQLEANLSTYTGENAKGYLDPLNQALGTGLNAGLFRSAAIPVLGFNLALEVKAVGIRFGDDDKVFRAQTEDGFFPASSVEAPTVIGSEEAVLVAGDNGTAAYFPGGFDLGSLVVPVPQLTIGSVYGTQAVIRYASVDTEDNEIGQIDLWGVGLRHNVSRYFVNPLPVDIAANFLYQSFTVGDDLIDASALTFGLQASRAFSVVEPYLGISFDRHDMSVSYESDATNPPTELDVDFDPDTHPRLTAGLGLNFVYVHLNGEINVSDQTSYLVGLSLGN